MNVTVALPTWNSASIIFLQLESLTRQEAPGVEWELIVAECESFYALDVVRTYDERLRAAGCVSIRYLYNDYRRSLGLKWRDIASVASGTTIVLAASDNYSPPDRVLLAHQWINEQGYDFADVSEGVFLNINTGAQATWIRPEYRRSGLWMCAKTAYLRNLNSYPPESGVDHWIKKQLPYGFTWFRSALPLNGVHTDGANTISKYRRMRYEHERFVKPFIAPRQDALQLIPPSVISLLPTYVTV